MAASEFGYPSMALPGSAIAARVLWAPAAARSSSLAANFSLCGGSQPPGRRISRFPTSIFSVTQASVHSQIVPSVRETGSLVRKALRFRPSRFTRPKVAVTRRARLTSMPPGFASRRRYPGCAPFLINKRLFLSRTTYPGPGDPEEATSRMESGTWRASTVKHFNPA